MYHLLSSKVYVLCTHSKWVRVMDTDNNTLPDNNFFLTLSSMSVEVSPVSSRVIRIVC